jgi:hypothetical protein
MLYIYVASVLSGCYVCLNGFSSVLKSFFLQVFHTHISSVSSVFFCMLQVLYLYISKVDWDVGYVATVFQVYVFNVSSILDVYCRYFIWMLQQ